MLDLNFISKFASTGAKVEDENQSGDVYQHHDMLANDEKSSGGHTTHIWRFQEERTRPPVDPEAGANAKGNRKIQEDLQLILL